jgi:hypothetical protein
VKRCAELAEGVVAYIEGDEPRAQENAKQVVAVNTPENVKLVAQAVVLVGKIPGAGGYVAPLTGYAELLLHVAKSAPPQPAMRTAQPEIPDNPYMASLPTKPDESRGAPAANLRKSPVEPGACVFTASQSEAVDYALAAPLDPARLETHTFQVGQEGARCSVFGADGLCARLIDGPFVLRDWIAMTGCPDQLLLGSSPMNEVLDAQLRVRPAWLVPARDSGAFGANLFIPTGERLVVAIRPSGQKLSGDPRCAVTWAGYRPRLLPPKTAKSGSCAAAD